MRCRLANRTRWSPDPRRHGRPQHGAGSTMRCGVPSRRRRRTPARGLRMPAARALRPARATTRGARCRSWPPHRPEWLRDACWRRRQRWPAAEPKARAPDRPLRRAGRTRCPPPPARRPPRSQRTERMPAATAAHPPCAAGPVERGSPGRGRSSRSVRPRPRHPPSIPRGRAPDAHRAATTLRHPRRSAGSAPPRPSPDRRRRHRPERVRDRRGPRARRRRATCRGRRRPRAARAPHRERAAARDAECGVWTPSTSCGPRAR